MDDLDELRAAFRNAYAIYAREGGRMKDLLLAFDSSREPDAAERVRQQQTRLTEAQEAWEQARRQYVRRVLDDLARPISRRPR
jgi:hypothetical protein